MILRKFLYFAGVGFFVLFISMYFLLYKKNLSLELSYAKLESRFLTYINSSQVQLYQTWLISEALEKDDKIELPPYRKNSPSVFLIISSDMCSACIKQNIDYLKRFENQKFNIVLYIHNFSPEIVRTIYAISDNIFIFILEKSHYSKLLINPYWGIISDEGKIVSGYVASMNNDSFNELWMKFLKLDFDETEH